MYGFISGLLSSGELSFWNKILTGRPAWLLSLWPTSTSCVFGSQVYVAYLIPGLDSESFRYLFNLPHRILGSIILSYIHVIILCTNHRECFTGLHVIPAQRPCLIPNPSTFSMDACCWSEHLDSEFLFADLTSSLMSALELWLCLCVQCVLCTCTHIHLCVEAFGG